jgi:hypothetical protein
MFYDQQESLHCGLPFFGIVLCFRKLGDVERGSRSAIRFLPVIRWDRKTCDPTTSAHANHRVSCLSGGCRRMSLGGQGIAGKIKAAQSLPRDILRGILRPCRAEVSVIVDDEIKILIVAARHNRRKLRPMENSKRNGCREQATEASEPQSITADCPCGDIGRSLRRWLR